MGATDDPGVLTPPAPPSRAPAHRWGLTEAVFGAAAGVVVATVLTALVAAAVGYHDRSGAPMPVAVTAVDLIGLWVGLVGAAIVAGRAHGSGRLGEDYGLRVRSWLDLLGGAAVGVACQLVVIPLLYLPAESVDHGLVHRLAGPANQETGTVHGLLPLAALLALVAVGAPVVEELFFRGLVLRGLLGRVPTAVAIVVTGLLFALAHFEAVQFAGLALFGVVLGVLAWRTGRLAPGIAAHAAFNATAVIAVVHLH